MCQFSRFWKKLNQKSLKSLTILGCDNLQAPDDTSLGYFFLPEYAQDTDDASQVEYVVPSLLCDICRPCLAARKQCAGNTGIVDCHLRLHRQLGAVHTRVVRRARVEAAFPILLLISASKERLSVLGTKYLKCHVQLNKFSVDKLVMISK